MWLRSELIKDITMHIVTMKHDKYDCISYDTEAVSSMFSFSECCVQPGSTIEQLKLNKLYATS